jgi:DNA phosphorothioation-dependent restriction protein DptH
LPRHGRAQPIEDAEELSDLPGSLAVAISSATATIATGQAGIDLRPLVSLVLGPDDRALLCHVHEVSDWVFTLDRNLGIEFFDHGRQAPARHSTPSRRSPVSSPRRSAGRA